MMHRKAQRLESDKGGYHYIRFEKRWPIVMCFRNFCWHVARWRRASPSRSRRAIDRHLPLPLRFVSLRRCSARRRLFSSSPGGCQLSWLLRTRAASASREYDLAVPKRTLGTTSCRLHLCFGTLFTAHSNHPFYIWSPRRPELSIKIYPHADIRWIFLEIH